MATYIYETIPQKPGEKPKRFEVQHPMKDPPLTHHPETGVPIRRLIAASVGVVTRHATPPRSTTECGGDTSG